MFGILAFFLLYNNQLDLNISDFVMLSVELNIEMGRQWEKQIAQKIFSIKNIFFPWDSVSL